jgi:ribonuclease VapC
MVIDTSAVTAILFDEPEADRFETLIVADHTRLISAASVLESSLVVEARLGDAGGQGLDLMLHRAQVEIIPVDADQVEIARQAFRTYGRGRHPARLNFGDCFAYALSKSSGEPLLFKGQDFGLTDVEACRL